MPAGPPSVRLARAWVSEILEEIDREDLVFAAQLGVSELVTNAILHGQPPVTVGVRGTRERPRIEVTEHDGNVRIDVADTAAVRPGPGPGVDGADDPADAPRSD